MRFVSKSPKLGLGAVIRERFLLALDGQRDLAPDGETGWTGSISVQFSQDGLSDNDIRFALAHWPEKSFTGRWLDEDGVSLQPVAERIGVYDTEVAQAANGWPDSIREKVEQWMVAKPNYGLDFILVEKVVLPAPWPSYNDMHHSKIAGFAEDAGQLEAALAYERENKNRPSVIAELEQRLGDREPVDGEVVAA